MSIVQYVTLHIARICKRLRSPGIDSQPGRIDSLESIADLLKCLQIRATETETVLIWCDCKEPLLVIITNELNLYWSKIQFSD